MVSVLRCQKFYESWYRAIRKKQQFSIFHLKNAQPFRKGLLNRNGKLTLRIATNWFVWWIQEWTKEFWWNRPSAILAHILESGLVWPHSQNRTDPVWRFNQPSDKDLASRRLYIDYSFSQKFRSELKFMNHSVLVCTNW